MHRSTRNPNFFLPPPPRVNPGHWNFQRLDRSNSRLLGPKWCSNALPYRQICLANPTKEIVVDSCCQLMFRDPSYDDAVFTRLELLQKQEFNIETVKSDLKIELIKSDNVNKQV